MDQQQGFRTSRGTADTLFFTKRIHKTSDQLKKTVYSLFINLTAVFDHVERNWMFESTVNRIPENSDRKFITLLQKLYSRTTTALAETPDDVFELRWGSECSESPMLFNLYMIQ